MFDYFDRTCREVNGAGQACVRPKRHDPMHHGSDETAWRDRDRAKPLACSADGCWEDCAPGLATCEAHK